jgi:hypothetical protein
LCVSLSHLPLSLFLAWFAHNFPLDSLSFVLLSVVLHPVLSPPMLSGVGLHPNLFHRRSRFFSGWSNHLSCLHVGDSHRRLVWSHCSLHRDFMFLALRCMHACSQAGGMLLTRLAREAFALSPMFHTRCFHRSVYVTSYVHLLRTRFPTSSLVLYPNVYAFARVHGLAGLCGPSHVHQQLFCQPPSLLMLMSMQVQTNNLLRPGGLFLCSFFFCFPFFLFFFFGGWLGRSRR